MDGRMRWAVWAAAALLVPGSLPAQQSDVDADVQLRAGVLYTDNLGRDWQRASHMFATGGVDLSLSHETPRLSGSLNGGLDYFHYRSPHFRDEAVGTVDAELRLALIESRLFWHVDNRFGQGRFDPLLPEGPGNREYVNAVATGPDLFVPLTSRTRLHSNARWSDRRFQRSDELRSEETSGNIQIEHARRPTSTMSAGLSTRRVLYERSDNPAFEIHSGYLRHERQLNAGSASLQVGVSRLHMAGETTTARTVELSSRRQLTARSTLTLDVGRDFSEALDQFRRSASGGDMTSVNGFLLHSDPLKRRWASIGYALNRTRSGVELAAGWAGERRHQASHLDREHWRVGVRYRRRVHPDVSLETGMTYREEAFRHTRVRADDVVATAALSWQPGRWLGLRAMYRYGSRTGRDVPIAYRENRWSLDLTWAFNR